MTTRNLPALFRPRSITLIGASNDPGSVGAVVWRNLASGAFALPIWPVNPRQEEIDGRTCFRSVAGLPDVPDLAVIATPARTVPGLIEELGARGCRAAVVISAGLDAEMRHAMLAAARPHLLRIVGPNCLGFISPGAGINASFSHLAPLPGGIAFLTQSGAIATSIIDWANGRGIGFSHVISLGDMSDVDFGDLLDYLALDSATRSILLYAENVTQARKFMSASRIAARAKPVIVVKAGRSSAGAAAAASHTGALAGKDAVYDAAFRRAGMLRVDTLRDLFDAAETVAQGFTAKDNSLIILTNGGGLGVMAADALEAGGGRVAALSQYAVDTLNAALPSAWSHGNPVDILGDAHGDRYRAALAVLRKEACGAVLVMNCPTGVSDNRMTARDVLSAYKAGERVAPWLTCWMGEATADEARRALSAGGMSSYETPEEAVRAFLHLAEYGRNQADLLETPAAAQTIQPEAREAAALVIDAVLRDKRETLTEPEAKRVLAAYGIPVVETVVAATPAEAARVAQSLNQPVAMKILSRQITHKTDVGGVKLNLEGATAVEAATREMIASVERLAPNAIIDGFTVQPMIRWPHAHELILGAFVDPTFGPCILFGHGGVATEVIADRVIGLAPLNLTLAHGMIARTRVARLLAGYRDRGPADLEKIANALVALSDLVVDHPEIVELDINPLLADAHGVIALDARIIVRRRSEADGAERMAIQPYPRELQRVFGEGERIVRLRPARPQDAAAVECLLRQTQGDASCHPFGGAAQRTSLRLTQIDYHREMTLVAEALGARLSGLIWLRFDPDFHSAEFALFTSEGPLSDEVRALMGLAFAYAKSRGARRAWCEAGTHAAAIWAGLGASVVPASAPNWQRCELLIDNVASGATP
jgi:acetyltransferase